MDIELINKLDNLINNNSSKETLISNIELFKQFYDNYYAIKYYSSMILPKVFNIVNYLLVYEEGELNPYFRSNIISYFIDIVGRRCNDLYLKDKDTNEEVLNTLVELGNECYQLRNIFSDEYISKLNDIDKSDIKHIFDVDIDRYFMSAFIQLLNKGYFELNIDNIKMVLSYLENNDFIDKIINEEIVITPLIRDFIYQYVDKYLKVRDFSLNTSFKDNNLLNALLTGKIKDNKLINLVIDTLDIDILLSIYNNDLEKFVLFIDSLSMEEANKLELFKKITIKDLSEPIVALSFTKYYMKYPNNKYFKYCFLDIDISLLFKHSLDYDISLLDKDYIEYIINNDIYQYNATFLLNIYKYYEKDSNIIPTSVMDKFKNLISRYNLDMQIDVDIECAKGYLRDYIVNNKKLNPYKIMSMAVSFTRYITGISDYSVYFNMSNTSYGIYNDDVDNIKYNFLTINKLLNSTNIEERYRLMFKFLNTICHESTHACQYHNIHNNKSDNDTLDFLKEELIMNNYPDYYKNNYLDINVEQDARKKAIDLFINIINSSCPEVIDSAKKYYMENMAKEKEDFEHNKKIFGCSEKVSYDIIFDRLIQLKPELIASYPILQEKYNIDGKPKIDNVKHN